MRKFLISVMVAALVLSNTVVAAEDEKFDLQQEGLVVSMQEKADTDFVNLDAEILEIGTDEMSNQITVKDLNSGRRNLVLLISDATLVVNQDGIKVDLKDLKIGDKISVVHSKMMTRSIPAQTNTYSIVVNNDETKASPLYTTVSEVAKDEYGNIEIFTADRMYKFVVKPNTNVIPYKTRNIVKVEDIAEGDTILVWFDLVTMSIPAMSNPTKIMLIAKGNDEETTDISFAENIKETNIDLGKEQISHKSVVIDEIIK